MDLITHAYECEAERDDAAAPEPAAEAPPEPASFEQAA